MRMHAQANLARFLRMAAAYKRRLKFRGQLLLEPKPQVSCCKERVWFASSSCLLPFGFIAEGSCCWSLR